MPKNKNAYTRYLIIDEYLRNPYKRLTVNSLRANLNNRLEEKGLSTIGRTKFHQDLAFMEIDLGAPIKREQQGQSKHIFYEDTHFSIKNTTLDIEEIRAIRDSLATLLQFKGLSQMVDLEELLPKLDKEFGLNLDTKKVIAFEENEFLRGLGYLNPLIEYIKNQTQLKITYQNFKTNDPVLHDFSPYFLKRHNQRWFLFGQVKGFVTLTNLALDRIESIETSPSEFIPNDLYDWDEYFDDMIGVSRPPDGELTKIKLWFSKMQAPYIQTKPIHSSMKSLKAEENGFTTTIEVIPNYELESLLLSFGNDCKVLEPEDIKSRLENRRSY